MTEYNSKGYKQARAELLAGDPICHWCRRAPATEADHLYEVDAGGTHADGMVPACKPCNAARGARHLNNKRARQQRVRAEAMNGVFQPENTTTTLSYYTAEYAPDGIVALR